MLEDVQRWIKETKYIRRIRLAHFDFRVWRRDPRDLPEFLVIGAQRSGTTFLHDKLVSETSAVCSPLQKEVHYFDNKYYRSKKWYRKFFEKIKTEEDGRVKNFETSPYYIYHPAVPKRVAETLPDVKLVVVLRNPVERAISHYKWMRQAGLESRSATEAFQSDARRLDLEKDPEYLRRFEDPLYFDYEHIHASYLRRSLYHIQLRRWLEWFEPSQIRVMSSNRLFGQPEQLLRELTAFLGLDYRRRSDAKTVNQNASQRNVQVSDYARAVAEQCLEGEQGKVHEVITDEMILGGNTAGLDWNVLPAKGKD